MSAKLLLQLGRGPVNSPGDARDQLSTIDELPTILVCQPDGQRLWRDSHITEVHQETTDDN